MATSDSMTPKQISILLMEVDGSLTSLSEVKGFRRYVKATADSLNITGTIQRFNLRNVKIVFETDSRSQMNSFVQFLQRCVSMAMVERIEFDSEKDISFKLSTTFSIIKNFSKGAVAGEHSIDTDTFEKKSNSTMSDSDVRKF